MARQVIWLIATVAALACLVTSVVLAIVASHSFGIDVAAGLSELSLSLAAFVAGTGSSAASAALWPTAYDRAMWRAVRRSRETE